jgi:Uncharacterized conserved protein
MEKIDLRKQFKELYSPSKKEFALVTVPPLQYLCIDGIGNPNTSERYQQVIAALYGLSYTLKFSLKKSQGLDYTVMGLEGLWWMPDMNYFSMDRKEEWCWTMMIMQPDFITPDDLADARHQLTLKGKGALTSEVRLERVEEGQCVQIMYIGAYDDEPPTIAAMHAYIQEHGLQRRGKHHEIYLSDARRVAPEKNRTILRQPVSPA